MRIEVLVETEEPRVYPLNKPKILIGSQEPCDIILTTSGISRKHLTIIEEDDSFYVIDQGSTNGSYINEERLVPGRRTEFTSFFPVHLGEHVVISLLSDEESSGLIHRFDSSVPKELPPKASLSATKKESTKVMSLKDLQTKKDAASSNRKGPVSKKKGRSVPKKGKEDKRTKVVWLLALVILGSAVYLNFFNDENLQIATPEMVEQAPVTAPKKVIEVVKEEPLKIDESLLTPRDKFTSFFNNLKCTTDAEKYLCDVLPGLTGKWGALQVGTMINVFFDGESYLEEAKSLLPYEMKDVKETEVTKEILDATRLIAALIYLNKSVPKELDSKFVDDHRLSFAFFKQENGEYKLDFVLAIKSKSLQKLTPQITEQLLKNVRRYGTRTLNFSKDYFHLY